MDLFFILHQPRYRARANTARCLGASVFGRWLL